MSSNADIGTGKESASTVEDLAKRFAMMLKLVHPLQPLAETVKNLVTQVAEQGHQQHALNLALLRLEQGDDAPVPCHQWHQHNKRTRQVRPAPAGPSRAFPSLTDPHVKMKMTSAISCQRTVGRNNFLYITM
jgi:hypothetical protein